MYSPQDPYAQQPSGASTYPPQSPYPPPQQEGMPYPPQTNYPPPYPYPPQANYQPQYPYPPQYPQMPPQGGIAPKNTQAGRAMIYGFISIVLSLLTLVTLVGFAGLITGTFAIVYGFVGLNFAKRFPNKPGTGQAVTAIVLGTLAWLLVIISFFLRSSIPTGSSY